MQRGSWDLEEVTCKNNNVEFIVFRFVTINTDIPDVISIEVQTPPAWGEKWSSGKRLKVKFI